MKHYFFLILNTNTYETYFSHGGANNIDEIKETLKSDEKLIKAWTVNEAVEV